MAKRSNTKQRSAQVAGLSPGARPTTRLTGNVTKTSPRSILKRKGGGNEGPRLMPQKWAQIQLLHHFVHVDLLDRLVQAETAVSELSAELANFKKGLVQLCQRQSLRHASSGGGVDPSDEDNQSDVSTDVDEMMKASKRDKLAAVPKNQALCRMNKRRSSGLLSTILKDAKKVPGTGEVHASNPKSKSIVAKGEDATLDESSLLSILSEDAMAEAGEALRRDQEAMRLGRGSVKPL
ncbi:hypothetical protein LTR56_008154 [Elasticomyces elasticus]|nr:hypothetical protein LTR56_008154 [Elasticomyces elasticus]KAK3662906.1 hypothetical protein LTR22_006309 [Elasticomyces elasticus]KAK4930101.1 hypothetical protein LTR49_003429 [Elasticomyces elasticus]KAK5763517.1 hypothetical protein LTS12_006288 [Elasticomyces elasticus]